MTVVQLRLALAALGHEFQDCQVCTDEYGLYIPIQTLLLGTCEQREYGPVVVEATGWVDPSMMSHKILASHPWEPSQGEDTGK